MLAFSEELVNLAIPLVALPQTEATEEMPLCESMAGI
jgi:hypothetical protein